jgi:hypothetical protein
MFRRQRQQGNIKVTVQRSNRYDFMVAAMPLGLPDVGTVFLYPSPPLAKSSKKKWTMQKKMPNLPSVSRIGFSFGFDLFHNKMPFDAGMIATSRWVGISGAYTDVDRMWRLGPAVEKSSLNREGTDFVVVDWVVDFIVTEESQRRRRRRCWWVEEVW